MDFIYIPETSSTNVYAREWSICNPDKDATIYTHHQTAGRGQRGNSWESEPGKNLTFSIVIHPKKLRADEQFVLSQMISLSLIDVLDTHLQGGCIKWPNDIYREHQKLGGILIENDLDGNFIHRSIIGVGLNINQITFTSDAPNPVSMKQITGQEFDLDVLLHQIVNRFTQYYIQWLISPDIVTHLEREYHQRLYRRQGFHTYRDTKGFFQGRIRNVSSQGILTLEREDATLSQYAFKEVQFIL